MCEDFCRPQQTPKVPTFLIAMHIAIKAASSSSPDEYYTVDFVKTANGKLSVTCSCKAGAIGQSCKHKRELMEGDYTRLADPDEAPLLSEALKLVETSDFKNLYLRLDELEKAAEEVKIQISLEKKLIARRLAEGI